MSRAGRRVRWAPAPHACPAPLGASQSWSPCDWLPSPSSMPQMQLCCAARAGPPPSPAGQHPTACWRWALPACTCPFGHSEQPPTQGTGIQDCWTPGTPSVTKELSHHTPEWPHHFTPPERTFAFMTGHQEQTRMLTGHLRAGASKADGGQGSRPPASQLWHVWEKAVGCVHSRASLRVPTGAC